MLRVAITGASGFTGSRFGFLARTEGARVLGLSRTTVPEGCCDEIHVLHGFGNADPQRMEESVLKLAETLAQHHIDVLVHLAAEFIAHHRSPLEAISLIDSNVRFGTGVLEACKMAGVARVVTAGTAWQHFEGRPYFPVSLYAATREAFESVARHYSESAGMEIVRLHFYDSYGEGDQRPKLLPILKGHFDRCIAAFGKGDSLPAPLPLGPCDSLINLLHVNDVSRAILVAARDANVLGQTFPLYAVRAAKSLPVREIVGEVAELFRAATGHELPILVGSLPRRPREMHDDWNFAPVLPHWTPRVGISDGLRRYFLGPEA